jgi:hypothetical protein
MRPKKKPRSKCTSACKISKTLPSTSKGVKRFFDESINLIAKSDKEENKIPHIPKFKLIETFKNIEMSCVINYLQRKNGLLKYIKNDLDLFEF